MLENKTYLFKKEFCKQLGISDNQADRRLDELLEWLKIFFDYEFIKGSGTPHIITIKEQYCEYEPLPRKNKAPEIIAFYGNEVDHILQYKPRNTGSNLAREIVAKNNKYNHKEGTAVHYIRPYLKENYEIDKREWCYIDYEHFSYDKIDPAQLKYLNQQFVKYLDSAYVAEVMGDQKSGYISKEEAYDKLDNRYEAAIQAFIDKYGFRPYRAGDLIKEAWIEEE